MVACALAAGLAMSSPMLAAADPDAVRDTQAKVQALEEQSSAIDLQHAKLSEQLDQANAKAKTLTSDIAAQRVKVDGMRTSMGTLALTQYQNSGLNLTVKLLASPDDDSMLSQLSTVQSLTVRTNGKLQQLQAEQATLTQQESTLQDTLAGIQAAKDEQAKLSKDYHQKVDEAQKLLDALTAEEQARLAELRSQEAARQLALAEQAAQTATTTSSQTPATQTPATQTPATKTPEKKPAQTKTPEKAPATSGGAAAAVAFAKAQVGKRYVMGSTGPNSYDCSGLTSAAWRQGGVSLPRTSQGQASAGVRVSVSQIQPGDIVVFYGGASHVGIYVGGGMLVDAANPRSGVRMISLKNSWMPIHSVRRVG
nr:C40 family peptidase [Tessaracoccus sp. SD287]